MGQIEIRIGFYIGIKERGGVINSLPTYTCFMDDPAFPLSPLRPRLCTPPFVLSLTKGGFVIPAVTNSTAALTEQQYGANFPKS